MACGYNILALWFEHLRTPVPASSFAGCSKTSPVRSTMTSWFQQAMMSAVASQVIVLENHGAGRSTPHVRSQHLTHAASPGTLMSSQLPTSPIRQRNKTCHRIHQIMSPFVALVIACSARTTKLTINSSKTRRRLQHRSPSVEARTELHLIARSI